MFKVLHFMSPIMSHYDFLLCTKRLMNTGLRCTWRTMQTRVSQICQPTSALLSCISPLTRTRSHHTDWARCCCIYLARHRPGFQVSCQLKLARAQPGCLGRNFVGLYPEKPFIKTHVSLISLLDPALPCSPKKIPQDVSDVNTFSLVKCSSIHKPNLYLKLILTINNLIPKLNHL